ncbi:UPAR/Ly6 domain-containing protein bero-like [Onthophagus taurus]|uniref:UPAR/Ly6 domain-containing protein bero-like n=1 Tax=Onthophagus taurus TaxID=166361 RepID=UPI000C200598|nr:uncharacterized protein LOC111426458 [Onthophagus taurus]
MAFNKIALLLFTVMLISLIYTVDALKCYKCTSFEMELCADYFNQTDIRRRMIYGPNFADAQMPKEIDCGTEVFAYPSINQRAVCVKKVETEYGRKRYSRECMFINRDLTTLECPQESRPSSHKTLESCDVCDTDLCNSSPKLFSLKSFFLLTFLTILLRI